MASIHRINALIAYSDGRVANFTSANDGQSQRISNADVDVVEAELYSWPDFRAFMESLGLSLAAAVSVAHIRDITWSAAMSDETGKLHIGGFEATGGSGGSGNTTYDATKFPTVDEDVSDKLETGTATASASVKALAATISARGSGYSSSSGLLSIVGGTSLTLATLSISSFSTILSQTEADYGGGELNGTFVPGTGYASGDTITLSDGTVVTIITEGTAGDVIEFTITTPSTSGHSNFAVLTQSSTSGGGSGFSLTQDTNNQGVFAATVSAEGEYTATPSNPVATTPAIGSATGATFIVGWGVEAITVVDGGAGYESAPDVTFVPSIGGAAATATLTDDVVTSIAVTTAGGYSSVPTVVIAGP